MLRYIIEIKPGVYLDTPYFIPSKTKDLQKAWKADIIKGV